MVATARLLGALWRVFARLWPEAWCCVVCETQLVVYRHANRIIVESFRNSRMSRLDTIVNVVSTIG